LNANADGTLNEESPELFSFECLPTVESYYNLDNEKECLDAFKIPAQAVDK
jgi:hypothetical protein